MYNKIFNVTRVKMSSWYKTFRNPYMIFRGFHKLSQKLTFKNRRIGSLVLVEF